MNALTAVQAGPEAHPLQQPLQDYGWLLMRLVPLFGTDRIVLSDAGPMLAIGVWNGKPGEAHRNHAMWLERDGYSLNALSEDQQDTVVRKFIQEAKRQLWGADA